MITSEQVKDWPGARRCADTLFKICIATAPEAREAVSALVRKMYEWRGYKVQPDSAGNDDRVTIYAEALGAIVGTVSLSLDRRAGLPADENFSDTLTGMRNQGRRLWEPSRLAVRKGTHSAVLPSLMRFCYAYSHIIHGFTDCIIEVHPRHAAFYERLLSFQSISGIRQCKRVGAPALLLHRSLLPATMPAWR